MRFLEVTLDTYQDTSGYMYLGLFITIHQITPIYKITIHVSSGRVMTTLQDTIRIHHAISFGGLLPVALLTEPTGCLIKR